MLPTDTSQILEGRGTYVVGGQILVTVELHGEYHTSVGLPPRPVRSLPHQRQRAPDGQLRKLLPALRIEGAGYIPGF